MSYRTFMRRVQQLDAVPVHRDGLVWYWNEDQLHAMFDGRRDGGNSSSRGGVRET